VTRIEGMSDVEQRADADLLVALPHDLGAFGAFYERYVDRVTAFAARRCSCAEDVADVVAQTFVRLLEVADRFDPTRGDPGPFVFGIAVNAARDLHRRGSRQRAIASKLVGRDLLDSDDIERIEAAIDARRAAQELRTVLADVPPAEQEMLGMVAGGLTPGQASTALGISAAAGWARLSRARRRVRSRVNRAPKE
jgi:RNA polymerase sigma factor (sigma-70 family)